jgi:hypothetical protein
MLQIEVIIPRDGSMDWFKGKSTGNHRFSHEIWGFPAKFSLNQSIEWMKFHSQLF